MEQGKQEATEKWFKIGFRDGVVGSARLARLSGRLRYRVKCTTIHCVCVCVCVCLCVCSALELFLQQRDLPLSDELSGIKEKIEKSQSEGVGAVGEVSEDGDKWEEKELWEVLEQAKPTEELLKWEQQIEDAIRKLQ